MTPWNTVSQTVDRLVEIADRIASLQNEAGELTDRLDEWFGNRDASIECKPSGEPVFASTWGEGWHDAPFEDGGIEKWQKDLLAVLRKAYAKGQFPKTKKTSFMGNLRKFASTP